MVFFRCAVFYKYISITSKRKCKYFDKKLVPFNGTKQAYVSYQLEKENLRIFKKEKLING